MEEDTEYLKLPLEDRCVHKLWKARLNGYEECTKLFAKITDERSPEFNKFAPLMKKFVTDSNAVAQEKALDAVLVFVENAHVAGRTAGDVTGGLVAKCLAAPKRGTQEKALEIILMYCEIEKYEVVQEELIKGFSQKNPKVVAACIRAVTDALREFGPKVIAVKPLVKQMGPLLEGRDKNVREEAKKMVIQMYRWVGQGLKPQLSSLKPVQVQELESEFEKLGNEKVVQTRFLRSQQELKAKMEAQDEEDGEGSEEEEERAPEVDVYDLLEAVDVLAKLPKDFYEKVEAKKWQERKEAMEALLPLTQVPKIEPGDFHDLMKALKKIITKDTNVMIVALAAQCMAGIAKGLKKKFAPFALVCTETILEKFKEKKMNVVTALREAIDAIYPSTSLESIQEILCNALKNKNPQIKAETCGFLARAFCYCTPVILNKKLVKTFVTELLVTLNQPDPTVRDNSAEALGTMLKVVGEKIMGPFIAEVDALKMQKIKEFSEKAEIKVKISGPKAKGAKSGKKDTAKDADTDAHAHAPAKKVVKGGRPVQGGGDAPKGRKGGGRGGMKAVAAVEECTEAEMSVEEALEKAGEVLSGDTISNLSDTNWKNRLAAMEGILNIVREMDRKSIPCQALMKTLAQKPGFKDNNFQVLKLKLDAIQLLAENSDFTQRSGEICIQELVEKLGDPKNGTVASSALTAMAEAAKLQWVGPEVMTRAFENKSPKVQEMALKWLAQAIIEFGFVLQPKALIGDIKKGLSHTSPAVRTAAITLCGTIYMYMGATLRVFFEDEKAALLQQIDTEFEKVSGKNPPAPCRGGSKGGDDECGEDDEGGGGGGGGGGGHSAQDLIPRSNISGQITSSLISELSDKNWKVRMEALQKISNIINEAKFITSDIGELATSICARMTDTNKNLSAEALKLVTALGVALGPHCKPHTRNIVPGMLSAIGDSKQNIRQLALTTLNTWVDQVGLKEVIDGEMFMDAFKTGSPFLKAEIFLWMAEKLRDAPPRTINKDELNGCVGYLYAGLEDRNAEVRKNAAEAVLPFMMHLGYDAMSRHTSKIKPSSKNTIMQALEKAKPSLPAKPAPKGKGPARGGDSNFDRTQANGPSGGARGGGAPGKKIRAPSSFRTGSSGLRKDAEDVDNSPLLQTNNLKQQRATDEQRLRVLRWDFTTPRAEFITQLKDQMATAGFNRQLVTNMFHQDFKFHIKAIDSLSEDLNTNLSSCIANLDLILRWLTIRFFDTNPSVIMKAMDYLQQVFQLIAEEDYHLIEMEAYSFLPFLIMKFGDPKDAIRGPARNIARQICKTYPASKVSPYLLDGLKAKNARQRAECLEALGGLIESHGTAVCQPSPGAALKEIAKQIADRDNSVRNAALNALVQVYFKDGEKVYKMVGSLSDKDMCLLEERIKRAGRNRPVIKKQPSEPEIPVVRGGQGQAKSRGTRVIPTLAQPAPAINNKVSAGKEREPEAESRQMLFRRYGCKQTADTNSTAAAAQRNFNFDYDLLEKLLGDDNPVELPQLVEIPDIDEILEYKPVLPPTRLWSSSRPSSMVGPRARTDGVGESEDISQAINGVILQVATPDANTVITALSQLDEVLRSEERRSQLEGHIDQLLITVALQYRLVLNTKMGSTTTSKEECVRLYRSLTNCLMLIFNSPLGQKASRGVLRDVIHVLINIVLDVRLSQLDDGPHLIRALNVLVVRIIEKAQCTQVFSAVLKLLHEAVWSGGSCKFTELVMKCNWKIIRILPSKKDELDVDLILLDLHNFLEAYPLASWSERPSDTPVRTVKTIITNLSKMYGNAILDHFSKIDNAQGTELHKYLTKTLKKIKPEEEGGGVADSNKLAASGGAVAEANKSPKRLSKTVHHTLAEIFRKIGSKENTKEGLIQLYEFKQKHPEADIEPFLRKSSQFFQNYIERGLKRIERERLDEAKMGSTASTPSENGSITGPLSSIQVQGTNTTGDPVVPCNHNIDNLVDQFRALAARAGFDNTFIDSAVSDIYGCNPQSSEIKATAKVEEFDEYIKNAAVKSDSSASKERELGAHGQ